MIHSGGNATNHSSRTAKAHVRTGSDPGKRLQRHKRRGAELPPMDKERKYKHLKRGVGIRERGCEVKE